MTTLKRAKTAGRLTLQINQKRLLLLCTLLAASCHSIQEVPSSTSPVDSSAELKQLIQSLGAEEIENRELARGDLRRRIREAMPLLRIAAESDSNALVRHEAHYLISLFSAGSVIWTFKCPHKEENDRAPLSVLGSDLERVYVRCGCWDKSLVALDIKTGRLVWEWSPEDGGNESFYLCLENNLILGQFDKAYKPDRLVALDARIGKTVWLKKGNLSFNNPVVVRGRVFIGGSDGVRVFYLETGDELWRGPVPAWTTSPLVTDRQVVAGSDDGKIRAFDFANGRPDWEFATAGGRVSPLCASKDRLFGGCPNRLYALDLKTGKKIWDIETTGWSHDGPHLVDGVLVYETNYMGPEDKVNGGWPTLTKVITSDPRTGSVFNEASEGEFMVADGHLWRMTEELACVVNPKTLTPLENVKECPIECCSGVHQLPTKSLSIENEEVALFSDPVGRLRSGWRWQPPSRSERELFITLGAFPIMSGAAYHGPRNSRIACIRAVDIDKD